MLDCISLFPITASEKKVKRPLWSVIIFRTASSCLRSPKAAACGIPWRKLVQSQIREVHAVPLLVHREQKHLVQLV